MGACGGATGAERVHEAARQGDGDFAQSPIQVPPRTGSRGQSDCHDTLPFLHATAHAKCLRSGRVATASGDGVIATALPRVIPAASERPGPSGDRAFSIIARTRDTLLMAARARLQLIMTQVLASIKNQLSEEFGSLELQSQAAKDRCVVSPRWAHSAVVLMKCGFLASPLFRPI